MNVSNNNINFLGIKVSKTRIFDNNIDIYKITPKDHNYLLKLKHSINLQELNPKLTNNDLEIYTPILKESIDNALWKNKDSYLLSCNNQPCGIMVTTKKGSNRFIDHITTWPYKKNKKAPFGCQILFLELYKNFLKTEGTKIELNATRYGSAISKYQHLGFKPLGGDNYTEKMRAIRNKIEEIYNNLQTKFHLEDTFNKEDIDLSVFLD